MLKYIRFLLCLFTLSFSHLLLAHTEAQTTERWSSFLPYWSSLAEKMGADLPLPLGISLASITLEAPIHVEQAELFAFNQSLLQLPGSNVKTGLVNVSNMSLRVDALVLPFLNVYGFYGMTQGDLNIDINIPPDNLAPPLDLISLVTGGNDIVISENFKFSGPTYGGGISLIAGYPITPKSSVFAMADANFSWTDLDVVDTTIKSTLLSYRLGLDTKIKGKPIQFWIGAMDNLATQQASLPLSKLNIPLLRDLSVNLNVRDTSGHTPLAGIAYQFNENWLAVAESRFGDRKLNNIMLSYRF